jgi:hypothetical protein
MNCPKCGTALPDNARFCYGCGSAMAAAAPPAAPAPAARPIAAPPGVTSLKCPQCGAPIHPSFGDAVLSCDYCGSSVSLGAEGWKQIGKHSLLSAKVVEVADALDLVHQHVNTGFLHRKTFEESKVNQQKLTFVPFWVLPVSATTNYVYTDVAVSVGGTLGTIAAAEVLGGGGRNRYPSVVPFPVAPMVNPTRTDTLSAMYEYPVVAVKSMTAYQPKGYEFSLTDRALFDKNAIPPGVPILNGDLGEDAAQFAARAYVTQLQSELAHKKHTMVQQVQTQVTVAEGELVHVPIWYVELERKGAKTVVLIDSHAGKIMQTIA